MGYEIGIKAETTNDTIENLDKVYIYKELHKINMKDDPNFNVLDTFNFDIEAAKIIIRQYRDSHQTDEFDTGMEGALDAAALQDFQSIPDDQSTDNNLLVMRAKIHNHTN